MRKFTSLVALAFVVGAVIATSAQAAVVTVGSPLTQSFTAQPINVLGTFVNSTLSEPGAQVTSPISGTVVRWHLLDSAGGPFELRVLRPGPGSVFTGVGTSTAQTPAGLGLQTFTTSLPIQAGDSIGLDNGRSSGDEIGLASAAGLEFSYWSPPLAEGSPLARTSGQPSSELAFNAEVQPPPTIAVLGATTGSTAGGTSVTISGTDLEGATAVKFGSNPAASFNVVSESQVTATSPAGSGSVPVTVTTVAGTATSGQQFTYQAPQTSTPTPAPISAPAKTCTVPKLKGKSLKVARNAIIRADCNVGRVSKKKGVKVKTAKVVGQSSKPGTVLPPRTAVNVTLAEG
jgi:IPT/TIG domain/PASTA domain